MGLMDVFSVYLYGLKLVAVVLAVIVLVSGLDDLFIDAAYWTRRLWRLLTVYSRHPRFDVRALRKLDEKPLAILVPAWQAQGVIGPMAELAATTLDYENYHLFVGTYPNDAPTQREVEAVRVRFPNVHKVVCTRPGPTSKADCLNSILAAIFAFEVRAGVVFEGFVRHDAQDVLSKNELQVFNFLVDRKDLIQLPVYPLPRKWHEFTGGHYLDEFAEMQGKDLVVREALAGQVAGAGAGTCLSRRAVRVLLEEGEGTAFDVHSAAEDDGIAFRLKAHGLSQAFVRMAADSPPESDALRLLGRSRHQAATVAVRQYFPATFSAAIGQKSRAIIGTVYQGFRAHGRSGSAAMNYFLWRERKGVVTHFAGLLAVLLALQLVLIWAYGWLVPGSDKFPAIFRGDAWFTALLLVNLALIVNRFAQRLIFVTAYYGIAQGLLSVPRLLWGGVINVMANWQALRQVLADGDARRVAWDKSGHEFALPAEPGRERKVLGQILLAQQAISEAQLIKARQESVRGLRLGSQLVHQGLISTEQLARALATQGQVSWEKVDALGLAPLLLARIPASMALHYAVLPLREEDKTLVLASESNLDPVSLAAMARKLGRPVRYVIAPKGQVVVGLRHWYARQRTLSARVLLDKLIAADSLTPAEAEALWQEYVSLQLLMGEVLQSLGRIDAASLSAVLLRQERSGSSLGRFLVKEGVISQASLDEVLQLQQQHQVSMTTLLERAGKHVFLAQTDEKKVYVA
jgi:adsorption protein B